MKFKVGDVVVTKVCRHGTPSGPMGRECTIRSVDPDDPNGIFYETDIPCEGGGPYPYWWGCENCFELKPPRRQEIGKWESCIWQPSPETVSGDHGA
jgi:hypothetical protein